MLFLLLIVIPAMNLPAGIYGTMRFGESKGHGVLPHLRLLTGDEAFEMRA